jgi:two-component system, NarL family, nitrate/nitrite response regulator NarL
VNLTHSRNARTSVSISVIVADDHPIVREGVIALLTLDQQLSVVGVAESFLDLWKVLQSTTVDVVVLDIGNMGAPPIATVTQFVRSYPNVSIVVFSSNVELAPELLHAGVLGYVVKEELTKHLLAAIASAHQGERFLSPSVQEYLERCEARPVKDRLTPQQLNTLRLLYLDLSTREIAQTLNLDEGTIYNYVLQLKQRTGCQTRKELIDWYRQVYGS